MVGIVQESIVKQLWKEKTETTKILSWIWYGYAQATSIVWFLALRLCNLFDETIYGRESYLLPLLTAFYARVMFVATYLCILLLVAAGVVMLRKKRAVEAELELRN